ncbi:hypothetical protein HYX12_02425, partial [Candidatus Woesearchaeota archaeon]|nr:hypothetical protein [Candidatus Woesearchaeota archaeon]
VAKKHNFNLEYVSIGCGGNSLCPYEGWHIVHGPSIRSARNVIGGKEEYVRALHPLQAPAEVKFPTVEVAGEMDVVPPG